jgi:hypothetical protein
MPKYVRKASTKLIYQGYPVCRRQLLGRVGMNHSDTISRHLAVDVLLVGTVVAVIKLEWRW